MERLRGSAESTVDEKGRIKVPAIFRGPIESSFGSDFFVTSVTGIEILVYPLPVWAAFEEKEKGSIEPGKLADFVVLSSDIMTVPAPQILKTRVTMTVVGGEIVHSER